jgi:hypothetical protein
MKDLPKLSPSPCSYVVWCVTQTAPEMSAMIDRLAYEFVAYFYWRSNWSEWLGFRRQNAPYRMFGLAEETHARTLHQLTGAVDPTV